MWATVADVLEVTGETVLLKDVAAASGVITVYVNRTEAMSGSMRVRDLEWLRRATAYQAVWQMRQPGYLERTATAGTSQDGVSVQWLGQFQQDLAPLAIRTLKNLSWKGSRSLNVPTDKVPLGQQRLWQVDLLEESTDELTGWDPL